MELKPLFTVFIAVFLAELGDKTQLATLLFATDHAVSKWTVFVGSASALVLAAGLGVVFGDGITQFIAPQLLTKISAIGFIAIGVWILFKA